MILFLLLPVTWQGSCLCRTVEITKLSVNVWQDKKEQKGNRKDENSAKRPEERTIRIICLSPPGRFGRFVLILYSLKIALYSNSLVSFLHSSAKFNKFHSST